MKQDKQMISTHSEDGVPQAKVEGHCGRHRRADKQEHDVDVMTEVGHLSANHGH